MGKSRHLSLAAWLSDFIFLSRQAQTGLVVQPEVRGACVRVREYAHVTRCTHEIESMLRKYWSWIILEASGQKQQLTSTSMVRNKKGRKARVKRNFHFSLRKRKKALFRSLTNNGYPEKCFDNISTTKRGLRGQNSQKVPFIKGTQNFKRAEISKGNFWLI